MEQHYKRYKCSNKDFYRWMVSEIEDFYPGLTSEDPLKRFYHLLDKNLLTPISHNGRKRLVIAKPPQVAKPLKHGPSFRIEKYWEILSGPSPFTENFMRFLDLKDIIMLMYTCKYFHEVLDQEIVWETFKIRDFSSFSLKNLRDDTQERVSEKLYYKYLYLSRVSGIPFHSGYFKAYGSPDVVKHSDSIVDFLCPKNEMVKKYAGEILMRNQCRTFDLKLSWLKEKNEICLWNGNPSLEYKKPENGNEEIETVNEFYPCFIKRYSLVDEDEEITEVFFLEDKYLVVKLKKKKLEAGKNVRKIFRILNIEEELHSIAKGLQPAIPFDYSFILKNDGDNVTDIKIDEFGVDFVLNYEAECDLKVSLLFGDQAVFSTENSAKPTFIFWNLKEKKKIDLAQIELQKPLNCILASKKSEVGADKIRLFLLDRNLNVYYGSISEKDGFILNQTIILPISIEKEKEEEEREKQQDEKELEAKSHLNSGKRVRNRNKMNPEYEYLFTPPKYLKELDQKFENKTRKYYHEVWNKTNEEWLIVHIKNNFHFVNLDEEKVQEFSANKDIGLFEHGNWTVYEDNLLITSPSKILYYKINFENHSISFRFYRQVERLDIGSCTGNIAKQWIMLDPCFTVIIFIHASGFGLTARATIVITSTQEFLYNTHSYFNNIPYKVQAEQFIRIPDRWENKSREIEFKFENSKLLVSTEKANFFFDMTLSSQPYSKVYLNGWISDNSSMQVVKYAKQDVIAAEPEVVLEEGEVKSTKPKMVNYGKLEGNLNIVNAKEKNNGWKKDGKSEAKKEADKEQRVLKGKGEKYQKNIRQGQRSDKIN